MTKKKAFIALLFNIAIAVLGTIGIVIHIDTFGWGLTKFYTADSNFLAVVAAVICSVYEIKIIAGKTDKIPVKAINFKYYATVTVFITFMIVVFILAPMTAMGYKMSLLQAEKRLTLMSAGLYNHFLAPILSLISLSVFEKTAGPIKMLTIRATLFSIVYGSIAIFFNIIKILDGPYPFLKVYNQPVWASIAWAVAILVIAWLMAFVVYKIANIKCKKCKCSECADS